jgi:hypothetical protein
MALQDGSVRRACIHNINRLSNVLPYVFILSRLQMFRSRGLINIMFRQCYMMIVLVFIIIKLSTFSSFL